MKRIYLAGPISHESQIKRNEFRTRAINIAYLLRKQGYAVYCPHADSMFGETALDHEGWLQQDFAWLSVSDECYVIAIDDDYMDSKGTMREIKYCKINKIPVYYVTFAIDEYGNIGLSVEYR